MAMEATTKEGSPLDENGGTDGTERLPSRAET
jgi:hypothetical protein